MNLKNPDDKKIRYSLLFLIGIIVVAAILLIFSSKFPDGLEKVAEKLGFANKESQVYTRAPIKNYDLKGDGSYSSQFFALIFGVILTLVLALSLTFLLRKKQK